LAAAEKAADEFGRSFAKAHMNDKLHYFVGAGTHYGATYSYAMCYWEEMHWIRTKSIHAAEFFQVDSLARAKITSSITSRS
ncbi:hypothetical protein NE579_16275, partial [Intestinimonas massiliensis]|nr:hypothetical protein [Intestinimonas massiliensis (ex Afouda et al. 2020)]